MSNKKYETIVFIGRFQPIHKAHAQIIAKAEANADQLIIIIGSAGLPRTYKNPFTAPEREAMIRSIGHSDNCRLVIEHNIDTMYNDQAWMIRVQEIVAKHTQGQKRIAIIGHDKGGLGNTYLSMFPQWEKIDVPLSEPLDATFIRDLYFRKGANLDFLKNVLPANVMLALEYFKDSAEFEQIVREREFVEKYKQQFASLPYAPIFVTTDAVVVQAGHVLMIRRKSEPGRGLWALPGGFVNAETDASVQDACIRELKEETGIKVPIPVLVGNIKNNRVFDAPARSARGRTITHAFKILLPDGELPKVKGADDADKAQWIPIGEIKSDMCFEDHYEIITWAIGV